MCLLGKDLLPPWAHPQSSHICQLTKRHSRGRPRNEGFPDRYIRNGARERPGCNFRGPFLPSPAPTVFQGMRQLVLGWPEAARPSADEKMAAQRGVAAGHSWVIQSCSVVPHIATVRAFFSVSPSATDPVLLCPEETDGGGGSTSVRPDLRPESNNSPLLLTGNQGRTQHFNDTIIADLRRKNPPQTCPTSLPVSNDAAATIGRAPQQ